MNKMKDDPLVREVRGFINEESLIPPGAQVLVALSGGPDSVCLLHVLRSISSDLSIKELSAAYVDHGLRSAAEINKEKDFCAETCARLGLPLSILAVDVKASLLSEPGNTQQRARLLRYEALRQAASAIGASLIATGHNADDQAETVIIRLLRGTGLRGLAGIPSSRGGIVRPLLTTARKDIEGFLSRWQLRAMQDSSNLKDIYLRNRVRSHIVPELRKYNPSINESLGRMARLLAEEEELLAELTKQEFDRLDLKERKRGLSFDADTFNRARPAMKRRLLRDMVSRIRGSDRGIEFIHLEEALKALSHDGTAMFPGGVWVRREHGRYSISSSDENPALLTVELPLPGKVTLSDGSIIHASFGTPRDGLGDGSFLVVTDPANLKAPLNIRTRRPGDSFVPFGLKGRKKLQDFFVDEKIPASMRDMVPILCSGEDILWVAGYRMDERFRLPPGFPVDGRTVRFSYTPGQS